MATPTRWRVLDPSLMWRHWADEDEWVVYSPRSASVHLLNQSAWYLLQLAAVSPRSAPELSAALAAHRGVPEDDALTAAVDEAIAGLDSTGLLSPDSL